jgi:predicted transcriptional regulator
MIITGRQIREARALLGLQRNVLAIKAKVVTTVTIARAESVDGEPPITTAQAAAIRQALERAGVEFVADDGGELGVRLRKAGQKGDEQ